MALPGSLALPNALDLVPESERIHPADGRFEELAALTRAKMVEHGVPGVALGVIKDGRLELRGFGVTSVDHPQPITPDTLFPLASISKTIGATAVVHLAEQGRLDLDAPVQRYLPAFRLLDEAAGRAVTIRHLLTHTPGWEGQLGRGTLGAETLDEFVAVMSRFPNLARPGEVWGYNNAGFGLLCRVMQEVAGLEPGAALKQLVFDPLGLGRTFTDPRDYFTYPVALPHTSRVPEVVRPFYQAGFSPITGGVVTSLSDLLQYALFHLTGDGGGGLLSAASLAMMKEPFARKAPTNDTMGLGWHLRQVGALTTAAHGGTLAGHCLHLQLVPSRGLALAILTNHSNGWRLVQAVENRALKLYEDVEVASGQALGHRGINESMAVHAAPLPVQPDLREYVGSYTRAPLGTIEVALDDGGLRLLGTGLAVPDRITFYGADLAFATSNANGTPVEFIRRPDGAVGWLRVNGRFGMRTTT